MGCNNNDTPRTKVVSQILRVVRMRESGDNHANNVDRVNGSTSGYTTTREVVTMARLMYSNPEQRYKYSFRNATAFLLAHYLLLRGESMRSFEFADLQFQEFPKIGAEGTYPVMQMISNQGKTNRFNKTQKGACMRNRIVEICPFMAVSFHLFWRWHCDKESFPNLNSNEDWFKMKLINGSRPQNMSSAKRRKGKEPVRGKVLFSLYKSN